MFLFSVLSFVFDMPSLPVAQLRRKKAFFSFWKPVYQRTY